MVSTNGMMVEFMRGNGKMENSMVRDYMQNLKARVEWACGIRVEELNGQIIKNYEFNNKTIYLYNVLFGFQV